MSYTGDCRIFIGFDAPHTIDTVELWEAVARHARIDKLHKDRPLRGQF